MPLGMELGLSPGDFVLDGDPAPSPKRGQSTPSSHFRPIYCGQTASWIKMALGMEVGLSLDDFVSWGPSPLPQKGPEPLPNFRQISTVLKRLDASQWHLVWR